MLAAHRSSVLCHLFTVTCTLRCVADLVVGALYLFLPAYVANMAPVVAKRLRLFQSLERPLDGGRRFRGQPLFGAHKTLRGVVVGVAAALVTAGLQRWAAMRGSVLAELTEFPYPAVSPILWGLALGGGALLGDLAKSFLKRRFGIPPGRRWFPWDQLDLILGAMLLGWLVYPIPVPTLLVVLVATPVLGLVVNLGGYLLSIKEAW